jgi:hypothetical protein
MSRLSFLTAVFSRICRAPRFTFSTRMNTVVQCRSLQRRSKICSTNWNPQSRAVWGLGNVLQRLRSVLSDLGNAAIPPPAQKTFEAEGEILEHALTKSLHRRNEAIKSLCSSVHRFRDATIKEECKSDYTHALQALWKALDRAEHLNQN